MIQFFQILFLVASIVLIVLNVIHFNKYRESKLHPDAIPHPIRWFDFILTSLVAVGCAITTIIGLLKK
ncbi:MAG TPA: hypothetical protein VHD35_05855 [Chitinophagaceae bacterium]|nr:hypothetical protein [Chitinophagaceae bacterium]